MTEKKYILKIAETEYEKAAALKIRHKVFVEEQHLFDDTDLDEHDKVAIYIVAYLEGTNDIVGAVRCYPFKDGIWFGGRLAVLKEYRGVLGARLVKKAVKTMSESEECKLFYAEVQEQNVHFFQHIGWKLIGKSFIFHGKHHEVMQAQLNDNL